MLSTQTALSGKMNDGAKKIIGVTRSGHVSHIGFKSRTIGAGLLAADEPEPGFFRVLERGGRDIIKGSAGITSAGHLLSPGALIFNRNKLRTNELYIRVKSYVKGKQQNVPNDREGVNYDNVPMLKHADVWKAIDRLAREYGYSASGLARQSGLDPTTFNKSKRITREGKLRWPSTESVAKILTATGANLAEFVTYVNDSEGAGVYRNIPLIGFAQAGSEGFFDDAGYPAGGGWDEIQFPGLGDPQAYALEVSGDSMEPVYRDGDTVIVSPQANVRRGDRVVVKTKNGEVMVKLLVRQTAHKVDLKSLNPEHEDRSLDIETVEWVARVVWANQ